MLSGRAVGGEGGTNHVEQSHGEANGVYISKRLFSGESGGVKRRKDFVLSHQSSPLNLRQFTHPDKSL